MFPRIWHICNAGCCLIPAAFVPPNCSETTSSQKTELGAQGETMVREQIAGRGITDSATLHAMRAVPRHEFPPLRLRGAGLRRLPAADRSRPDHLAALHRGIHDRSHTSVTRG